MLTIPGNISRYNIKIGGQKKMLSGIAKKIIESRLYDKGVKGVNLDNILIDPDDFKELNDMYDWVVNNYNVLEIR